MASRSRIPTEDSLREMSVFLLASPLSESVFASEVGLPSAPLPGGGSGVPCRERHPVIPSLMRNGNTVGCSKAKELSLGRHKPGLLTWRLDTPLRTA